MRGGIGRGAWSVHQGSLYMWYVTASVNGISNYQMFLRRNQIPLHLQIKFSCEIPSSRVLPSMSTAFFLGSIVITVYERYIIKQTSRVKAICDRDSDRGAFKQQLFQWLYTHEIANLSILCTLINSMQVRALKTVTGNEKVKINFSFFFSFENV